ncbi:hypothetical protein [Singulisphaera acidiphila]|uniref:Uncharacterized protein n=1 Tax=Singulisphaera acidiphila (strain ATCC BAA-1392 / DSM 18658 / VKM B-2454 / MOB10) TaxID=886293 RepID=L0DKM8_SINAD|nr:hypothetical protein [Singulisphaera acidiphila]AGA29822.1 hypothetical protein Sinac_5691 [Singulisphaera acidiphila DSM 18658]
MRHVFRSSIVSAAVIGAAGLISGCVDDADHPDAKIAEKAIGITDNKTTKAVETSRDLQVVKDTKVIDTKTGETLSETTESTPVKITKESKEKVNVDVNVGQTKATRTEGEKIPAK